MTLIRKRATCSQHNQWYEFSVRYTREATRGIRMIAVLGLLAGVAMSQSTSQLNGTVSDPSGASVIAATITLTDSATGLQRSTMSNAAGLYQFLDVPPGKYRLQASAKGFAPFTATDVTLAVNTPSTVNIKLQVAGVAETVTVGGEATLINRTDASLGNVIEQDQIAIIVFRKE